jgi:uncharacterized membrane protein YgdD (TMEM256/DUF423 family)
MSKIFLLIGSILGALSVAIGAFGAHGLKSILEANQRLETFETAVKYQFYHTFAILLIGFLALQFESKWLNYAGYSFLVGMLIFSGSLYILCLTNIKWLGAITPIGGLAMIAGWLMLFWAVYQK